MSASQVEVVNLALTRLGQDRAVSVSDDLEAVRVMNSLWDMTRDTLQGAHPWRFAIVRDSLAALATAPAFGFTVAFPLPEHCLRLVQVQEDWVFYSNGGDAFTIEQAPDGSGSRAILCDEAEPLSVRYVKRVMNVGLWPPAFCRAMSMALAMDAREKLAPTVNADDLRIDHERAIRAAKQQNAIEMPPQRVIESEWLSARG